MFYENVVVGGMKDLGFSACDFRASEDALVSDRTPAMTNSLELVPVFYIFIICAKLWWPGLILLGRSPTNLPVRTAACSRVLLPVGIILLKTLVERQSRSLSSCACLGDTEFTPFVCSRAVDFNLLSVRDTDWRKAEFIFSYETTRLGCSYTVYGAIGSVFWIWSAKFKTMFFLRILEACFTAS